MYKMDVEIYRWMQRHTDGRRDVQDGCIVVYDVQRDEEGSVELAKGERNDMKEKIREGGR